MTLNYPTFSLQGRKALVTGASRGIGQALAQGLAYAGADVAVAARNEQDLQTSLTAIRALGRKGVALSLDVTDLAAIRAGVDAACQQLGGLDILINNAGIEQVCPSLDVDEALWDRILDTNLKGVFHGIRAAVPVMKTAGGGTVLTRITALDDETVTVRHDAEDSALPDSDEVGPLPRAAVRALLLTAFRSDG